MTLWWIALGAGFVVAVVVWALLETLRRAVKEIQAAADDVLVAGGKLAQNTWTVQLLNMSRTHVRSLVEELERSVP